VETRGASLNATRRLNHRRTRSVKLGLSAAWSRPADGQRNRPPPNRGGQDRHGRLHDAFRACAMDLSAEIVGQAALVERLLIALLADGHLLVEGAPGLAKTTAIRRWPRGSRPTSPPCSSPPTCCRPT
jgi:hypothetical protein